MNNFLIKTALFLSATFLSVTLFAQGYTFKKVGEIRVESLADVRIRDYDAKRKIFAGFLNKRSEGIELAIFDENGRVLTSKKREGEGPEDYRMSALTMGFSADGNIWVQTSMELLKYDLEFNLIKKTSFEPKTTTVIYSGPRSTFVALTNADTPSFALTISDVSNRVGNDIIPSKTFMLDYFDANDGKIKSVIPLSARNGFKGIENEKFSSNVNAIFTSDSKKNELYFTTSLDNEITVYNPINWHVIKRIPVKHESFQALDDIPIRESNLPSMPSGGRPVLYEMNRQLLVFDDRILGLMYVKGESESMYERRKSEGQPIRFYDPDFYSLILFKDGVQLPGEHTISTGLVEMALPDNKLLVKASLGDEEPDYIPFEIWQLVEN
ncbi:hypothetical protein [Algoriphagus sp.]|uniref:hypothetical protein n=1 Tax=Algoriphagus sp. TaxID=1872435 RepID=UPI003298D6D7